MAGKLPSFQFYSGDYLRDTQVLTESAQVAYDRIMCEHMRNISSDMSNIGISSAQLNFFTKRLSDDDRESIMHVLTEVGPDFFQIEWVAHSISKSVAYAESRSKNRRKKPVENGQNSLNHMKTHDDHMEDEVEDEDEDNTGKGGKGEKPAIGSEQASKPKKARKPSVKEAENKSLIIRMEEDWGKHLKENHAQSYYANPKERAALGYIRTKLLFQAKEKLKEQGKQVDNLSDEENSRLVIESWRFMLANYALWDDFDKKFSQLSQINGRLSNIISAIKTTHNHDKASKRNFTGSNGAVTGQRVEPIPGARAGAF